LDHELERRQIDGLNRSTERQDQLGHLTRSFRRMHADVMARFEEQATLLDTSAAVVSTLDSQDVLIRILQQAQRLLDLDMCAIVALDQGANIFRAVASLGLSKRYAEQLAISPDEHDSPTMRAIRLGEVVQIYDTDLDPSFAALRPRARAEGYRSFASIPLRTTHAQPAALVVYNPHPKTYNSRELSLLSHFANHAAMAIENAELYARSDERWQAETRRMQALVQSMESGLIMEDLNGTVLYANRVACDYGACSMETLVGKPVRHYYAHLLAKAHHPDKMRAALDGFLFGNEESISIEQPFNFNEGQKYLRIQGFVVKDVTGQMIGRGQILRDITRRYQLDRMKSSLISTASHELRTPLAVIKGYATTLLAKDVNWDRDAQLEFLEAISTETDRINDLVNNLLDMSRIEAGNLELKYLAATPEELI
jgi:signal transduction histidine kinase